MNKALAVSLLLAATALAGCGRMGDLERPVPVGAARADADTPPRVEGETIARPADRQNDRQRSIDPAPPRTLPIEGQGSDPFAVAPQGALPDPYSNPQ